MTVIESPRTPARPAPRRGVNLEKWGWIYMRASGVLLLVLIFGHLFANLMVGEGVKAIDFGFVAGKWASPFWQWWDVLMLWLALIHGANGMRTLVNDYTNPGLAQKLLKLALVKLLVLIRSMTSSTRSSAEKLADPFAEAVTAAASVAAASSSESAFAAASSNPSRPRSRPSPSAEVDAVAASELLRPRLRPSSPLSAEALAPALALTPRSSAMAGPAVSVMSTARTDAKDLWDM